MEWIGIVVLCCVVLCVCVCFWCMVLLAKLTFSHTCLDISSILVEFRLVVVAILHAITYIAYSRRTTTNAVRHSEAVLARRRHLPAAVKRNDLYMKKHIVYMCAYIYIYLHKCYIYIWYKIWWYSCRLWSAISVGAPVCVSVHACDT